MDVNPLDLKAVYCLLLKSKKHQEGNVSALNQNKKSEEVRW